MTKYEIEFLDSCLDKFEERAKRKSQLSSMKKIPIDKIPYSTIDNNLVGLKSHVERTARKICSIVSIHGNSGLDIELVHKALEQDDALVDAALKMLEKLEKIKIIGRKAILSENMVKIQGQVFKIEIEKVVMGKAIVLVNSKWQALLHHYDYRGPRELIRKGREFKAIGELYRDKDKLNIRVKQIL
jgi:Fanconi anemia group M protein